MSLGVNSGNVSVGAETEAEGILSANCAVGARSNAQGDESSNSAVGYRAEASGGFARKVALGSGANDIHIVTSDNDGNLATDGGRIHGKITELQSDIDRLNKRDGKLADGIAIAMAMANPVIQPNQNFAMRVGWGTYDGRHAGSVSAVGVVSRGAFGSGSTVAIDGGVGFTDGEVAGRAGLSFGF